jgi:hypothetical protein
MPNVRLPSDEELVRFSIAWPAGGWTWDRRYNCVVSSFNAADSGEYEAIVDQVFPSRWDHKTITRATPELQRVVEGTQGLRAGQFVSTPKVIAGDFAFVLWWPWGDDATISARVVLSVESTAIGAALRERFEIDEE